MSAVGVYNADGEPLGIEYHYDDPPEYDDDRDPGPEPSDIGPFPGCCKRGDWSGAKHQPSEAFLFVPHVQDRAWFHVGPRTLFLEEVSPAYRWVCEYCGREGTKAELEGDE